MNVVCVNYTFDPSITQPAALLETYETRVGWAGALTFGVAQVRVVQRFSSNSELTRDGISYRFVSDPAWKDGSLFDRSKGMNAAVAAAEPDVVHVNGLQFARQAWRLKRMLRMPPVVLQDHANSVPRHWVNRWTLGRALRTIDAVSFVSEDQALPWLDAGLLDRNQRIFQLSENSSHFNLTPQSLARARTGLTGNPLCLWVGRLNRNKDP